MPDIQGLPRKGGKTVPVSKAQQKAVNKYMAANYDRINLTVAKGQRDTIKAAAAAVGESVNAYINTAITLRMDQDSGGTPLTRPQEALEGPQEVGVVPLPPDTLETAQTAAEAAGEAVPVFVARAVETQAKRDKVTRRLRT